jgi:hypothetical protein
MGCKFSNDVMTEERQQKLQKLIDRLFDKKIIGFSLNLSSNRITIDQSKESKGIAQVLIDFVKKQRIGYIEQALEIFIYLISSVEIILEEREKAGLRFFLINFDKFFYDSVSHKILLNDIKISSNYTQNRLLLEDEVKANRKTKCSIQPLFYDEEISKLFLELNLINNYSYENCKKFYSFVFYNFFVQMFKTSFLDDIQYITPAYNKFRKEILSSLQEIKYEMITLETLKNILRKFYIDNNLLQELNIYMNYQSTNLEESKKCESLLGDYKNFRSFYLTCQRSCCKLGKGRGEKHIEFSSPSKNECFFGKPSMKTCQSSTNYLTSQSRITI